ELYQRSLESESFKGLTKAAAFSHFKKVAGLAAAALTLICAGVYKHLRSKSEASEQSSVNFEQDEKKLSDEAMKKIQAEGKAAGLDEKSIAILQKTVQQSTYEAIKKTKEDDRRKSSNYSAWDAAGIAALAVG